MLNKLESIFSSYRPFRVFVLVNYNICCGIFNTKTGSQCILQMGAFCLMVDELHPICYYLSYVVRGGVHSIKLKHHSHK